MSPKSIPFNELHFTLDVGIQVKQNEKVSGIQFDLIFPKGFVIESVQPAESARTANKMVSFNRIWKGTYRIIIAGLNREPIASGNLIQIQLKKEDKELSGNQKIEIKNVVMADPDGNSVSTESKSGEIRILNPNEKMPDDLSGSTEKLGIIKEESPEKKASGLRWAWILGIIIILLVVISIVYRFYFHKGTIKVKKQGKKKK